MKKNKKILLLLSISLCAVIACSKESGFESSGCGSGGEFASGEQTITSDDISRVYYLKLPEGYDSKNAYPLVFAFHGTGGQYSAYLENEYYNLHGAVGDEAILVYPNALMHVGQAQWDYESDQNFFDDLYEELESNLCFDTRKVFASGHSSGAGFAHTLGCEKGNILRAIGPVAGGLVDHSNCIGQVAVIQIHGETDAMVPIELGNDARDYWAGINSCSSEATGTNVGVDPYCEEYIGCDTDFPVQYCKHDLQDPTHDYPGHAWPDFAGDAIWNFFKSLPLTEPSSDPGTGGSWHDLPGTISFKINFPSDLKGTPEMFALALYPPDTTLPETHPIHLLNNGVPVEGYQIGVTEFNNIDIDLWGVEFGDYTLSLVLYMEGGTYPVPSQEDYYTLQNITINSTTITVETPLELVPMQAL